jgi:glycine cleavage system H lipoate-binding protein
MTAVEIVESLVSFGVGIAGRVGVFFLAGLALAVPALGIALLWRALGRGRGAPLGHAARVAPNHTWLEPRRDGALRVGLDEIAGRILPSATAVELPRPGQIAHRGDPIAVVSAGGRVARVGSPVDGTVVAVNARVRRNPALVKDAPYGDGWLFAIAPADEAWKRLPGGPGAEMYLAREHRRLARFLEEELGAAAADGGELVAPAPALLGEAGWRRAVAAFLGGHEEAPRRPAAPSLR